MTRILLFAACLVAISACGEAGSPGSLTARFDGRINSSAAVVTQTR